MLAQLAMLCGVGLGVFLIVAPTLRVTWVTESVACLYVCPLVIPLLVHDDCPKSPREHGGGGGWLEMRQFPRPSPPMAGISRKVRHTQDMQQTGAWHARNDNVSA